MDTAVKNTNNKSVFSLIISFFASIILGFFSIFYYALLGIKALTFDLIFKKNNTYNVINKEDATKKYLNENSAKKEKVYKYSAKKMAKLEEEYQELQKDLQTSGATRSKNENIYIYKAQDTNGKIISGTMNGYSKLDVNAFLINEGYKVFSIKTSPLINVLLKETSIGLNGNKMSTKELVFWLTQLSTYLKAGITLNDAIKILSKQMTASRYKKRAFQRMSYELALGSSFSSALEKQGDLFPALLINMIKAAEASGTLVETLDDMANYYTEIDETKKQMKSAMMYPIIISVFAIAVIVFIMLFIIPKFVAIYEQNDIALNGLTAGVINFSNFLKNNILIILAVIFAIIILIVIAYRNIRGFRKCVQKFLMHLPVIKDLIIYNELAIFTKTFASLLRNNVFITESIDILSKITNNEIYKEILYMTINNIVKGEKISEAFKDHWAVPDVAYFMIVTGESTGELPSMMQKVSDYYQGLHRNQVNTLKAFVEPVLICLLAIVVGVVIISVVVPMFGMYQDVMQV